MTRTDLFQLCLRPDLMLIPLEPSSKESLVKWGNVCSGIMSLLNQSPLHSGFKFAGTPIEPHLWGASFATGMSRILALRRSICILQYQALFGMHRDSNSVFLEGIFQELALFIYETGRWRRWHIRDEHLQPTSSNNSFNLSARV